MAKELGMTPKSFTVIISEKANDMLIDHARFLANTITFYYI